VVRAGFVDTLVTDASLAQAVLGQDHDPLPGSPARRARKQTTGRAPRRTQRRDTQTGGAADG
jgi:hypothetical protein